MILIAVALELTSKSASLIAEYKEGHFNVYDKTCSARRYFNLGF
jgi:hypothetical protein